MVSLSWVWPCLAIYPHGFSGGKRRCGNKLSFHGVESHQAGALLQVGDSSRSWTCPDLMPPIASPQKNVNPRHQAARGGAAYTKHSGSPENITCRCAKGLGLGLWNCKQTGIGDHSTIQTVGVRWTGFFNLSFSFTSLLGTKQSWKVQLQYSGGGGARLKGLHQGQEFQMLLIDEFLPFPERNQISGALDQPHRSQVCSTRWKGFTRGDWKKQMTSRLDRTTLQREEGH